MRGMRNVGVAADRPAGGEGERVDRPQRDAERHAAGCAPAPAAHLVRLPAIRSIGPALPGGGVKGVRAGRETFTPRPHAHVSVDVAVTEGCFYLAATPNFVCHPVLLVPAAASPLEGGFG